MVYGTFNSFDAPIGRLYTLFQPSRLMRVAVVPTDDAGIVALFVAQSKQPVLVQTGWAPGTGATLPTRSWSSRSWRLGLGASALTRQAHHAIVVCSHGV
jgi:hypothetical protein